MLACPSSLPSATTLPPWRSTRNANVWRRLWQLTRLASTPAAAMLRSTRDAMARGESLPRPGARAAVVRAEQRPGLPQPSPATGQVGAQQPRHVRADGHLPVLATLG